VRVLAFDPGPQRTGWAVLERVDRRSRDVLVGVGCSDSAPHYLARVIEAHAPNLVAVETCAGFMAGRARFAPLMATAQVAGLILGLAHGRFETLAMVANAPGRGESWRLLLTGQARAGDDLVLAALRLRMPTLPRMNVHSRDALGLAIVALDMLMAGRQ
jgi:Holliday junction resolvasome RuvABC endonuclease subunit